MLIFGLAVALTLCGVHGYCMRYRGIGLCELIASCPGRVAGETVAMLTVGSNEVRVTQRRRVFFAQLCGSSHLLTRACAHPRLQVVPRAAEFELQKWRPWRPEPVPAA